VFICLIATASCAGCDKKTNVPSLVDKYMEYARWMERPLNWWVDKIGNGQNEKKQEGSSWCWWKIGAVGVGAVSAVAVAPAVLTGLGFTSAGVAAGSLAATIQATVGGNVVAGGLFAASQSAGAAGLGASATVATAAVGGTAGYAVAEAMEVCKP